MTVIDKLNEAQQSRDNKYSKALGKSPSEQAAAYTAEPNATEIQLRAIGRELRMLKAILVFLVLLILTAGVLIVLFLRNSPAAKKETAPAVTSSKAVEPKAQAETKVEPKAKIKPNTKAKTRAKRPAVQP
jgi:hypothetical protein